jgi:hypothetical protein
MAESSEEKINTIPEPFNMPEKEREVVDEVTTKCGENCRHCKHTEACDIELHFRTRYCGLCRMHIFHRMQEWQAVQYELKKAKSEKEGTQEFMATGRVFFTNPATYEYVVVNTGKKFSSGFDKLDEAVAEYLADPDRDLSLEESLHKSLRIKCGQQAKVFTQVYLGGVIQPSEMEKLVEKFGRIAIYSSEEFMPLIKEAPYEYIHLNEHVKFKSEHEHISDAITEYLATYKKRPGVLRKSHEHDETLSQVFFK